MKILSKILLGSLLLSGLLFVTSGCVTEGYVSGGGVFYGADRGPWFRDGPWMDGNRGYHDRDDHQRGGRDVYISPPRLPAPPRIRRP